MSEFFGEAPSQQPRLCWCLSPLLGSCRGSPGLVWFAPVWFFPFPCSRRLGKGQGCAGMGLGCWLTQVCWMLVGSAPGAAPGKGRRAGGGRGLIFYISTLYDSPNTQTHSCAFLLNLSLLWERNLSNLLFLVSPRTLGCSRPSSDEQTSCQSRVTAPQIPPLLSPTSQHGLTSPKLNLPSSHSPCPLLECPCSRGSWVEWCGKELGAHQGVRKSSGNLFPSWGCSGKKLELIVAVRGWEVPWSPAGQGRGAVDPPKQQSTAGHPETAPAEQIWAWF